jgi:hypothetical protein
MPDTPPEIRIARSAGAPWVKRFGPSPAKQLPEDPAVASGSVLADVNTVVGSIGPMGNNSSTPAYTAPTNLGQLTDVQLGALNTGDVLRWAGDKWRNYNEINLTDGGNF